MTFTASRPEVGALAAALDRADPGSPSDHSVLWVKFAGNGDGTNFRDPSNGTCR
ncbi:MAG: hypothetical protein ACR2P2_19650 [Nakamurella sp.]